MYIRVSFNNQKQKQKMSELQYSIDSQVHYSASATDNHLVALCMYFFFVLSSSSSSSSKPVGGTPFLQFCVGKCDTISLYTNGVERVIRRNEDARENGETSEQNASSILQQHTWKIEIEKDMNEYIVLEKIHSDACYFHIQTLSNGIPILDIMLPYRRQPIQLFIYRLFDLFYF